jgi:hypothetical protein
MMDDGDKVPISASNLARSKSAFWPGRTGCRKHQMINSFSPRGFYPGMYSVPRSRGIADARQPRPPGVVHGEPQESPRWRGHDGVPDLRVLAQPKLRCNPTEFLNS